jgi:hypothetical protein
MQGDARWIDTRLQQMDMEDDADDELFICPTCYIEEMNR